MIRVLAFAACVLPTVGLAQNLSFPSNAKLVSSSDTSPATYEMPVNRFENSAIPVESFEGQRSLQIWKIEASGLTTLQILAPLRSQLEKAGFEAVFECRTETCGGFDFRFGTEVASPPEMQVDLGDFRFLATKGKDGDSAVSLFVSKTSRAAFVQVISVSGSADDSIVAVAQAPSVGQVSQPAEPSVPGDFGAELEQNGRVILRDLLFESGSSELGATEYASLKALAAYLAARPDRSVALVGHTDAVGRLDGNITLSRLRAESVVDRLARDYGVERRQLTAEGMGYLAPVATNLTPEGREANRRVEVILTSTE